VAAALALLVVLSVSLVIMRVGAAALTLTGVSQEVARFQAQSAFLGVGFTTRESELVLAHPVRRRIVTLLMLLGNAGLVAGMSSVVLVFLAESGQVSPLVKVAGLLAALAIFGVVATSRVVDRPLTRVVEWALRRWTRLDLRDYVSLLRLAGEFSVVELPIAPGGWLADRTLAALDLRSEGALVLGIEQSDGSYLGVPRGPTHLRSGDVAIVYGRASLLEEIGRRSAGPAGDRAHVEAVAHHRRRLGLESADPSPPAGPAATGSPRRHV
jgi:hypothetical protein